LTAKAEERISMEPEFPSDEGLCDPAALSAPEAIAIAKQRAHGDPLFGQRLARSLMDGGQPLEAGKALRLLEILAAIFKPLRVGLIGPLLHHPDPRVQSKAALLVGKGNQDVKWVRYRMLDRDARVRANALEALWDLNTKEARSTLVEALADANNRVVGNALLGLYRIGEPGCVDKIVELAGHADEKFRGTAVWVMQQSGDPSFIPILTKLLQEGGPLQAKVMRALTSLKMAGTKDQP
jgi:HEAT repeat protein